jgi:hypothetical protein
MALPPVLDEDFDLEGQERASELYAREGTPCASCTCSYMTLRESAGTSLGFAAGAGLTLRVCTKGREPLVAESGTDKLWCEDYSAFATVVPLPPEDLERMQAECSRGFLGDLAQGVRPLPRDARDLRWYDQGFREGWLPPHRIEEDRRSGVRALRGPWEQFTVVGVTPAFGDGHTPAVGRPVLQARDRRSYLLPADVHADDVRGPPQTHAWWVNQVSAGAALPLEHAVPALRDHLPLVLRGGEQILSRHGWRYILRDQIGAELRSLAEESLAAARAALKRHNAVVARLCVRQGLRAAPDHPELRTLALQLDGAPVEAAR